MSEDEPSEKLSYTQGKQKSPAMRFASDLVWNKFVINLVQNEHFSYHTFVNKN